MRTVRAQSLPPRITRMMPSTMHNYEEAAKVVLPRNEQMYRPHESSVIHGPIHLHTPISAENALSSMHSGFFSVHRAGDPHPRILDSSREGRRAGIKRAREDSFLQDVFECKRPVPDNAAMNGTHASPSSECYETHGHCTNKKVGETDGLRIASVYHQNVGSFLIEEKTINPSLIEMRTDNKLDKRISSVVAHNHTGNRDNTADMRSHFRCASLDIRDKNSVSPCCFPAAFAEKKTLVFQEEDHAISLGQAQRGKQSFPSSAQLNSKVLVDVTNKFQITTTPVGVKRECMEDDVHRLTQRHKQIEFGKNTLGYERYIELIPKSKRKHKDPKTPNPKQVCSKRSWDGQIRKWRRLLHDYDPPAQDGEELAEDFALLKSKQKHEKVELNKDSKTPDHGLPCRPSQWQENSEGEATVVMAKDAGLSIYEDWMDI